MAKKDRRRLILAAALKIFAEQGLISPPIPSITRLAGVATGTFYCYFASRDDLIAVLFAEVETQLVNLISSINLSSYETTETKIRELIATLLKFFLEDSSRFFFIYNFHNSPYGAALRIKRGKIPDDLGSVLSQLLQTGIDEGWILDIPLDIHFKFCVDVLMAIVRDHHLSVQRLDPLQLEQIAAMSLKSITK